MKELTINCLLIVAKHLSCCTSSKMGLHILRKQSKKRGYLNMPQSNHNTVQDICISRNPNKLSVIAAHGQPDTPEVSKQKQQICLRTFNQAQFRGAKHVFSQNVLNLGSELQHPIIELEMNMKLHITILKFKLEIK